MICFFQDNLDSGKEVVPIITRYEGFFDCFHCIVSEEGVSGLFKGFGTLVLQYTVQFLVLRLTFASLKEVLKLMASESVPPLNQDFVDVQNSSPKKLLNSSPDQ